MSDKMMKAANNDPELALNDAELAAVAGGIAAPALDSNKQMSESVFAQTVSPSNLGFEFSKDFQASAATDE